METENKGITCNSKTKRFVLLFSWLHFYSIFVKETLEKNFIRGIYWIHRNFEIWTIFKTYQFGQVNGLNTIWLDKLRSLKLSKNIKYKMKEMWKYGIFLGGKVYHILNHLTTEYWKITVPIFPSRQSIFPSELLKLPWQSNQKVNTGKYWPAHKVKTRKYCKLTESIP